MLDGFTIAALLCRAAATCLTYSRGSPSITLRPYLPAAEPRSADRPTRTPTQSRAVTVRFAAGHVALAARAHRNQLSVILSRSVLSAWMFILATTLRRRARCCACRERARCPTRNRPLKYMRRDRRWNRNLGAYSTTWRSSWMTSRRRRLVEVFDWEIRCADRDRRDLLLLIYCGDDHAGSRKLHPLPARGQRAARLSARSGASCSSPRAHAYGSCLRSAEHSAGIVVLLPSARTLLGTLVVTLPTCCEPHRGVVSARYRRSAMPYTSAVRPSPCPCDLVAYPVAPTARHAIRVTRTPSGFIAWRGNRLRFPSTLGWSRGSLPRRRRRRRA